jgi:hypothetical protein
VRYIGGLRHNTAMRTDERVRLASEMVQGSLAMKMLSWESPVYDRLTSIRRQENKYQFKTAHIRACNTALQFIVTPLVSFATFATFRARGGTLTVPSVFYALSLLSLPRLYMVNFFVLGEQSSAMLAGLWQCCAQALAHVALQGAASHQQHLANAIWTAHTHDMHIRADCWVYGSASLRQRLPC